LLLLLVPRHPQRFAEVAGLLAERRLGFSRRSSGTLPDTATRVWLGDSMGEMAAYYALADVAVIGGTLLPFGGQNLIEAAACNCPVLLGPHSFNFAQASQDAVACGAARQVVDAARGCADRSDLLQHRQRCWPCARRPATFSQAHRGATARTWNWSSGLWRFEQRVDSFEVAFGERADRRLQLELGQQGVETGLGQIAPGNVDLILGVEHVDVDAYANLVAEPVRLQRTETRNQRRFQRPAPRPDH
jgi:hypothetical protein